MIYLSKHGCQLSSPRFARGPIPSFRPLFVPVALAPFKPLHHSHRITLPIAQHGYAELWSRRRIRRILLACATPGCHRPLRPYPLQSDSEPIEPFPLIYFEACSSCSHSKRIESVPFHVPGHGQLECLHALASASPKARIQKLYFHSMMTIRACSGACTRRCTRIKCFELCPRDSCPPQSSLSSTYVPC